MDEFVITAETVGGRHSVTRDFECSKDYIKLKASARFAIIWMIVIAPSQVYKIYLARLVLKFVPCIEGNYIQMALGVPPCVEAIECRYNEMYVL